MHILCIRGLKLRLLNMNPMESFLVCQGSMLQVSPHFLEQTLDKKLMSDLRVSNLSFLFFFFFFFFYMVSAFLLTISEQKKYLHSTHGLSLSCLCPEEAYSP